MTLQVAPAPTIPLTINDDNGNPVAGALYNTYVAGTLTPQASYADNTNSPALNTNPVVANAAGQLTVYLDESLGYHIVVTDSTGLVTLSDKDNIFAPTGITSLSPAAISAALGYTPYDAANPDGFITPAASLVLSGDVTGTGTVEAVTTSLSATGVTAGTYNQPTIVVDAGGRISSATNATPILTTKGDLAVFSTTATREPVGTNGQVLTADSSQATGISWQDPEGTTLTNAASTDLVRTGGSGADNNPDPALSITITNAGIYQFVFTTEFFSPTAGVFIGVGFTGTFSSNYWGGWFSLGGGSGGQVEARAVNTQHSFSSGIDDHDLIVYQGFINITGAGTLSLIWGNSGAGGNSMTRSAGSNVIVTKVG